MSDWITVPEMSKRTEIPQQTLRRYLSTHSHLLRVKKENRSYQLHNDSYKVLVRMRELYTDGKTSEEVDKVLTASGVPTTLDVIDEAGERESVDVSEVLTDIKQALDKQTNFNAELLTLIKAQSEKMDQQQRYIEESLKKRDAALMQSLKDSSESRRLQIEEKKQEEAEKPRKWWQFGK